MHRIAVFTGFLVVVAFPLVAQLHPVAISFEETLERARQSAPAVVAARMRIDEARARVIGASLRFPSNPTLEVEAGHRSGQTSSTDYGVTAGQEIDLPQRRRARIDAAQAVVVQEEQRARETEREVLRNVAITFLRAVESRERADAARSGKRLADEALRIAERRYAAGDVAQLDVNLARTAVARSDAEMRTTNATLTGFLTQLQVLLGITDPISAQGSLREALSLTTTDLIARAADRPDVRILAAEIVEAEAEQQLAKTLRWPDFGLRVSYNKEEGDRIVLGGVGLTLPVFNRGEEASAIANARLAWLRAERAALTRTIEAEVRGAVATNEAMHAAASEYERSVLPLIEENERLAVESYDVGQIGLADLLLVRREALEARRSLVDQLIETRLAEVELRARTGVWK